MSFVCGAGLAYVEWGPCPVVGGFLVGYLVRNFTFLGIVSVVG